MLSRMVYDQSDDPDWDEPECRARMTAVFAVVAVAALLGGLALGFVLDWLQGRL
jgi:hypothetical protein